MSTAPEQNTQNSQINRVPADQILRDLSANELVFAVVGPIGSGTSWVAEALSNLLSSDAYGMAPHIIKASEVIKVWTQSHHTFNIDETSVFSKITSLQNAGDEMRLSDPAAVAVELVLA